MFRISLGPIAPVTVTAHAAGGFASFEGRVRNHNVGRSVVAIEYEAYSDMASTVGDGLVAEAMERYGLSAAEIVHRVGRLEVGETAVWISAAAAHRGEAFAACRFLIDEVKRRLPIWKKEFYSDGSSDWVLCTHSQPQISEAEYSARQRSLPEIGDSGQARLRNASVLVVGAGGLGAPALLYLAGAGVGRIGICEPDLLEASNLHRQVIYRADDVGLAKVGLAAAAVRSLNPLVTVVEHSGPLGLGNAHDLIGQYELVLDCTDNFYSKFLLNDACVALRRPLVQASIYRFEGHVMVIDPAAHAGCLRCLWPETPTAGCVGACADVGVLGVTAGVFGLLQAAEAVKYLLDIGDRLTDTVLIYDVLQCRMERIGRVRAADCPACGGVARSTSAVEVDVTADLAGYRFVDIREPAEVRDSPAPAGIDWTRLPVSLLADRHDLLQPAVRYLLVCAAGSRSRRLAEHLRARGILGATSLAGGMSALRRRRPLV